MRPQYSYSGCPMTGDDARGDAELAYARQPKARRRRWCVPFSAVLRRANDLIDDLMSAGIHRSWKEEMVALPSRSRANAVAMRPGRSGLACGWG